jgi:Nuclease-related domain
VAYDVDTRPGAWVIRQAARRGRLFWFGAAAALALVGAFVALAVGHRVGIVAAVLLAALLVAVKPRADQAAEEVLRWLRGARAEESVGETLNELRREGWIVMHDIVQPGEGNVDHLISGPNGVYLIETKLRRYEESHLTKAKRQAAKLNRELDVWVSPVICLHERRSNPFRTRGVWVVPQQHLLTWLREQRNQPAAFERLARFADTLADPG